MDLQTQASELLQEQLTAWPIAQQNYAALKQAHTRIIDLDGVALRLQCNPARIVSSGAKTDARSIAARPCFLCEGNRPQEQQGIAWREYTLLINPFPIFPEHYTIVANTHEPQNIQAHFADMLALAHELPRLLVFYNGPRCGASAPDHMHFQAGTKDFLPYINRLQADYFAGQKQCYPHLPAVLQMHNTTQAEAEAQFSQIYNQLADGKSDEAMMNIVCLHGQNEWHTYIFPRTAFRPWQYAAQGEKQLLVSPATVELGGTIITPVLEHFEQITADDMADIYRQISPIRPAETLAVGIVGTDTLHFRLQGTFRCLQNGNTYTGVHTCTLQNGSPCINELNAAEIMLEPQADAEYFELTDVTIGINFHWQRHEHQRFRGALRLIAENGQVRAINQVQVEEYLESVISSEMSATSSLELLKAHAVISRSWVLAPLLNPAAPMSPTEIRTDDKLLRWYERDAHTHFDVCADDHCQRYQGITRATTAAVQQAVKATCGEVLTNQGRICDARFSKCCGGISERFESCWADQPHSYLAPVHDAPNSTALPDLTCEAEADRWIRSAPPALCNTHHTEIIKQVLNSYDQETTDFYRWQVRYTQAELSALIKQRSGINFGDITALVPIKRGPSGRIYELKIVGTLRTLIIGKELEIRRWLSETHLYSSAFVVDHTDEGFVLTGAGWGHGVGLCQIGAATMAAQGYNYRQILQHYFSGATIEQISTLRETLAQ